MMRIVADIGTRVRCLLNDDTEHFGEVVRLETLEVEEDDGTTWVLSPNHPVIRLEDGREVLGIECFWTKI